MTHTPNVPKRNWAAVVLAAAGAYVVVTTALNGANRSSPDFPTTFYGLESGLLFVSFALVPVAILVAFVAFGLGAAGLAPLGGNSARSRLLFLGTGVFALAAQYSYLGGFFNYLMGGGSELPERVTTFALTAVAVALAVATSVVVFRAGVVRGAARWALPAATLLTVVSAVVSNLFALSPNEFVSNWGDIPHGLGIAIVGIAYWRVGLVARRPVPEAVESLAE